MLKDKIKIILNEPVDILKRANPHAGNISL